MIGQNNGECYVCARCEHSANPVLVCTRARCVSLESSVNSHSERSGFVSNSNWIKAHRPSSSQFLNNSKNVHTSKKQRKQCAGFV
jgi:hypothetical protein